MPTSRKRPAAAAKARAARQAREGRPRDRKVLLVPPWRAYLDAAELAGEGASAADMEDFAAHYPFRISDGKRTTLAEMAQEDGKDVAEVAEASALLESQGFLEWDPEDETAWLTLPEAAAGRAEP